MPKGQPKNKANELGKILYWGQRDQEKKDGQHLSGIDKCHIMKLRETHKSITPN
jgi:hypothetical protein